MSKKKKKNANYHPQKPAAPAEKKKVPVYVWVTAACAVLAVVLLLVLGRGGSTFTTSGGTGATETTGVTETSGALSVEYLEEDLTYYADIVIRDLGTVTVKLDQSAAPITCANFVSLANSGFYDGLTFHRIIEGFMMQGGDPNGDGTGGSSQKIRGEFTLNGVDNPLSHTRGAISMARSSAYDSASSQFFIVHQDSSASLDGKYAAFGYVTEGMDIVDAICQAAQPINNNGLIAADAQPVIETITIRAVED